MAPGSVRRSNPIPGRVTDGSSRRPVAPATIAAVDTLLERLGQTQALPPTAIVLALAAVALLAARTPAMRHAATVPHEGAHAVVALLVGRSVSGIRLHRDASGLTSSRGRAAGPGLVATVAAGYPGPALLGLLSAWLLSLGRSLVVLWATVLVLAALVLLIRNWFGLVVLLVAGAALVAVTGWADPRVQTGVAYLVVWSMLLSAPSAVIDLLRSHRRGRGAGSDSAQLAHLTGIPAIAWTVLFLLVTTGCLVLGSALMLGRIG